VSTQAEFAATLVDEWALAGIRDAVVCPGSRSAPLATALLAHEAIRVHVRLDERSAAFFALGCALGSGRPSVVLTTSGTAAAELHPAVLEADLAGVPLIVCTADRPPELHGVGAPQTVHQQGIFGRAVRFACDPGVPDEVARSSWRSLASRLVAEATSGPAGPGPVHANLAFREPLSGEVVELPVPRPAPAELEADQAGSAPRSTWHRVVRGASAASEAVEAVAAVLSGLARGVVVAGAGAAGSRRGGREDVLAFCRSLGWPILADPRAWPRDVHAGVVAAVDGVLRASFVEDELVPDVVLHLGAPHASKVLGQWCVETARRGTVHVLVDPFGRVQDPDRVAALVVRADPGELCAALLSRLAAGRRAVAGDWLASWEAADHAAQTAIDGVLSDLDACSEPGIARGLFALLPDDSTLVVSSSMPIRDVEWYARPRPGAARVLANRGANGIDGVVSTVLGVAATTTPSFPALPDHVDRSTTQAVQPTVGLLGDLALLHDLSGLVWGRAEKRPDATLVVVDNGGGGIFDFLPYAATLDTQQFARGFRTPQAVDIAGIARALGCGVREVTAMSELADHLAESLAEPGTSLVLVHVSAQANVALHDKIHAAVAAAVDRALRP